jgi:hypothetical protein
MPQVRKLDLVPEPLRDWLRDALSARGFGDILGVTDELNSRLADEGLELRVGKTAVGEFSKLLKDQREAFGMAQALLSDLDIEAESDLHRTLMQMIATSAMKLMQAVREDDEHLGAKDLMSLGRMLRDLMHSAGIREKIREDERARIEREAARAAREAAAEEVATAGARMGLTAETVEGIKAQILGVRA